MRWTIGKYLVSENLILNLILLASVTLLYFLLMKIIPAVADKVAGKFHLKETLARKLHKQIGTLLKVLYIIFLLELLQAVLFVSVYAKPVLGYRIIDTETFSISLSSLIKGVFVFYVLLLATRIFITVLQMYLLHKHGETEISSNMDLLIYNSSLILISLITLSTIGLNWKLLLPIVGGLGIGIGFGLRDVANNFVSGFVILTTKTVKRGDWITLQNNLGTIVDIGIRTSTLRTVDNVDIIIPNSHLITNELINWSYGDNIARLHVPVGVSYSSDIHQVRDVLIDVAHRYEYALKYPEPEARFTEFGNSSLNFELLVWIDITRIKVPMVKSALNYMIWDAFKDKGIQVPFPQRDVWFKNDLKIDKG
jgi:small-conductance mechanosensitive channel